MSDPFIDPTMSRSAEEAVAAVELTRLPHWAQCFIHNASEVQTVDSFKTCGECWHVWQTEADFASDVSALYIDAMRGGYDFYPTPPLDQVYSCPLCAHDF